MAKDKMKAPDYDHNTECNLFWHIRRSFCVGEFNSAVVEVEIKVITSSPMRQLNTDHYHPTAGCWDFEVRVPCIINTEKIAGGDEIVVKYQKKADNKEADTKKRVINAFNAVATKIQKRLMVSPRCLVRKCRVTGMTRLWYCQ